MALGKVAAASMDGNKALDKISATSMDGNRASGKLAVTSMAGNMASGKIIMTSSKIASGKMSATTSIVKLVSSMAPLQGLLPTPLENYFENFS